MTEPANRPTFASGIESARLLVARVGFSIATTLLVAGLALGLAGVFRLARPALTAAIVVLVAMPLTGVVALLAEEIRRRDWVFASAAGLVLALLGDSLVRVLWTWWTNAA